MDEKNKFTEPVDLENEHPILDEKRPIRNDDIFNEETSSELVDHDITDQSETDMDDTELKNVYGWISIALSVVSFFLLPFVLAIAGIVVGFIARAKDAPVLGNTAIVIGVLSIIVRLFILPLI